MGAGNAQCSQDDLSLSSLPFAAATTANRHFTKPGLRQPHPGEREIARDGATLGEAVLIRADYNNLQVPQANLMTLRLMFNLITADRCIARRQAVGHAPSMKPRISSTSELMNPDPSFLCFQVEDHPDVKLDFLEKLHTRQFPMLHPVGLDSVFETAQPKLRRKCGDDHEEMNRHTPPTARGSLEIFNAWRRGLRTFIGPREVDQVTARQQSTS
ncbi:hypothetical protein BKA70DRAFT_1571630 [Coprinopsis sp. MPI-PUGE-AT-0042]|nr:hypothetical protein BKA70DRAFT_1571630 [Coprinopsis sp. MPI-PUGE-AT-0042]